MVSELQNGHCYKQKQENQITSQCKKKDSGSTYAGVTPLPSDGKLLYLTTSRDWTNVPKTASLEAGFLNQASTGRRTPMSTPP